MSDQSHSAQIRAARIVGVEREHVRLVASDRRFRLDIAHKWFFQPYEAGCLMVKDVNTLENAFAVPHDMLQDTIWGHGHPNFADRGPQLSRSVRALKIWVSVKTFAMRAFRRAVSSGLELAARAEDYVRSQPSTRSTGTFSPASSGGIARSYPPRCSTGGSRYGSASSTTPRPGTTCARRLKRSSAVGTRRWSGIGVEPDVTGLYRPNQPPLATSASPLKPRAFHR